MSAGVLAPPPPPPYLPFPPTARAFKRASILRTPITASQDIPDHIRDRIQEIHGLPEHLCDNPESFLNHNYQPKIDLTRSGDQQSDYQYHCSLHVSAPNANTFQVTTVAASKKNAKKAAYQSLLVQLYERGDLYSQPAEENNERKLYQEHEEKVPSLEVERETEKGIIDVYNYAASYGLIPTMSRSFDAKAWTISFTLEEQDIHVSATSDSALQAEDAAVGKFKAAAEAFRRENPERSQPPLPLNTATSAAFAIYLERAPRQDIQRLTGLDMQSMKIDVDVYENPLEAFHALIHVGGSPEFSIQKVMATKEHTVRSLGHLISHIILARRFPKVMQWFVDFVAGTNRRYVEKHLIGPTKKPVEFEITQTAMEEMENLASAIASHRNQGQTHEELEGKKKKGTRTAQQPSTPSKQQLAKKSQLLKERLDKLEKRPDMDLLRTKKSDLPMNQCASDALKLINSSLYSIVVGATGSGKTTQLPQILLDDAIRKGEGAMCNIYCTQPRRIAATSVALRVAHERGEELQQSVGYQVRFDRRAPAQNGSILYCTAGILLEDLQHDPDRVLESASHIILDEVHERTLYLDLLLVTLKNIITTRVERGQKVPRVILMSATIDTEPFAAYFRSSLPVKEGMTNDCPALVVPGRTFPVKEFYLDQLLPALRKSRDLSLLIDEDLQSSEYLMTEMADPAQPTTTAAGEPLVINWETLASPKVDAGAVAHNNALVPLGLVVATIAHIVASSKDDGAILVFLPGMREISVVEKMLYQNRPLGINFSNRSKFRIFILHSLITENHRSVFAQTHARKVILSTNIAESSVTLPDVRYIIDTGKVRQKVYDPQQRLTSLQCTWISNANVKQRAGRAGRVAEGFYYALYRESRRQKMLATAVPEVLHSDLQESCLTIKSQKLFTSTSTATVLAQVLDPPSPIAVDIALEDLINMGALNADETSTPLGRVLASLPMHPALGKMIVLGIIFRCLSPMLVMGVMANQQTIFREPLDRNSALHELWRERRTELGQGMLSDHLTSLNAFKRFIECSDLPHSKAAKEWCQHHFISHTAMANTVLAVKQIKGLLSSLKLIDDANAAAVEINSDSVELLRGLLTAGLSPNIALQKGKTAFRTIDQRRVRLSPSPINGKLVVNEQSPNLLAFSNIRRTERSGKFLEDTTLVAPLAVLLFGGPLAFSMHPPSALESNGWLTFCEKHGNQYGMELLRFLHESIQLVLEVAFLNLRDAIDGKSLLDDPICTLVAQKLPLISAPSDSNVDSVDEEPVGQSFERPGTRWDSNEDLSSSPSLEWAHVIRAVEDEVGKDYVKADRASNSGKCSSPSRSRAKRIKRSRYVPADVKRNRKLSTNGLIKYELWN
ncbi:P-loop containing nucleoside triphosphate hydrolase protein [Xylariaceae sp. FL0255]|nr:P-loop containing nucleoside triphosphate hydrolase protein [Xylariaceae sp. FL0255]